METEWDPAPNGPSPLANADKASTVMYPALLCEMIERSAPFKASTLFANMNEGRDTDTGANGIDEDKLLDWEGLGYPIMLSNVCEKMTSGYKTVSLPCERFFPSKAFTRLFEGTFREMRGVAHQMNEIILDMEVDILELGVLTSEDQDPTRFKEQALKVHALLVGFMDYIASDTSDLAALGVKQTEWVEKTLVSFRKAFDYTPEFVDQTRSLVETEILRYGVSAEVDRSPKAAGAPHLSPREASFVTGVWHAANEFTPGKISERKSRLIETFTDNRAMMAGMYLPPVAITYTFVAELHTQSNDPCHPDTSALYLEKMWHLEAKSYTEGYVWSKVCVQGIPHPLITYSLGCVYSSLVFFLYTKPDR